MMLSNMFQDGADLLDVNRYTDELDYPFHDSLSTKLTLRRQAHLCVLVETCTEKLYIQLVEALCAEHNINLIKVQDGKKLGEWVGLCKIDKEGNARKVVGCSCVVVKDFGEESEASNFILDYFRTR